VAEHDMTAEQRDSLIDILNEVWEERILQHAKWGEQNHPDGTGSDLDVAVAHDARKTCQTKARQGRVTWQDILEEEVCEAYAESDPVKLRAELVQVAAVAVAWAEKIDRDIDKAKVIKLRGSR
jgi:hypothetical protein